MVPGYPTRDTPFTGEGVWIAEVLIAGDGKVREVWVLREPEFTPPWPEARKRFSEAVRQWIFAVTKLEGTEVPVCMTVTLNTRSGSKF